MSENRRGAPVEQTRRIVRWAGIAALLLLPLLAMRFTEEVAWTPSDFAFAALLLCGAGAIYEVVLWRTRNPVRRGMIGAALVAVVAVIWAEGAVGIFH